MRAGDSVNQEVWTDIQPLSALVQGCFHDLVLHAVEDVRSNELRDRVIDQPASEEEEQGRILIHAGKCPRLLISFGISALASDQSPNSRPIPNQKLTRLRIVDP